MKKMLLLASLFLMFSAMETRAQNRASIGAAEVNGTFRNYFNGKFKGSYNEIKIQALGKGKLRVAFELVYPHLDGTGAMTANMGSADGTAMIAGDTAVYEDNEFGQCKITIKFVKSGTIEVEQDGTDGNCGFGFNVNASGRYKKSSSGKPNF